jgi:hypothetical protein
MCLEYMEYEGKNWIYEAQEREQRWVLGNMAM